MVRRRHLHSRRVNEQNRQLLNASYMQLLVRELLPIDPKPLELWGTMKVGYIFDAGMDITGLKMNLFAPAICLLRSNPAA